MSHMASKRVNDSTTAQPIPKRKGIGSQLRTKIIRRNSEAGIGRNMEIENLLSQLNINWIDETINHVNRNSFCNTKSLWKNETSAWAHLQAINAEIRAKKERAAFLEGPPSNPTRDWIKLMEAEELMNEVLVLKGQSNTTTKWLSSVSSLLLTSLPSRSPTMIPEQEDHRFARLVYFGQALYIWKSSVSDSDRTTFRKLHRELKQRVTDYVAAVSSMNATFVSEAVDWSETTRENLQPRHLLFAMLGFVHCREAIRNGWIKVSTTVVVPNSTFGYPPHTPPDNDVDTRSLFLNTQGYLCIPHPIDAVSRSLEISSLPGTSSLLTAPNQMELGDLPHSDRDSISTDDEPSIGRLSICES